MYYQRIKEDETTASGFARHGSIFIADIQIQNMTDEDVTFDKTSLSIQYEENRWKSDSVFNGHYFPAGIEAGANVSRKDIQLPTNEHGRFKKHTVVHSNQPNDVEVAFYFGEDIPEYTNGGKVQGRIRFVSTYKTILGEKFVLTSDPIEFEFFKD